MNELTTTEEFENVINSKGVTLLDFNAPWCAPCRAQEPILEKISEEYEGKATVAAMNVDNHADTAGKLGVQSIPTLVIFKNGKEIQRFIGLQSEETLKEAIENIMN